MTKDELAEWLVEEIFRPDIANDHAIVLACDGTFSVIIDGYFDLNKLSERILEKLQCDT